MNENKMKECLEKLEVPLTEAHKITLNKVVADLKAMKVKKSIDDYVEEFYKVFEFTSDERAKRYPMLMELYINFMREIQNTDKNYRLLRKTKNEIDQAIENTCTKGQMQLVNCSQCIQDIMNDEMAEKAFIFGYVMCNEINEETKNIYE